jgi:hypothetical protein
MSEEARTPIVWFTLLVVALTVNVTVGELVGRDAVGWVASVLGGVLVALVVGVPLDRRLARATTA